MSHKVKSSLYFASLLLAVVTYNFANSDTIQNTEVAENTIEQVSTDNTLN